MNQQPPAAAVERFDVEAVNKKENRSLYKTRDRIHPKRVKGAFRSFKWLVMGLTLGIYYVTPWLRWDRGPGAPDQAVLIDFPARRFYFFFIEIWPQEVYYIAGLLIMAGIGLFLVTAVFGRAWCGYSCPQTVWVDLFLVVERWIEGDRAARIRLDAAPMSADKAAKRVAKHAVWLLISMGTGGAWVFYYADAPTLAVDLVTLQAPSVAYISVAILTFTTFSLGGLMREQVCTYMCPWPRIQGAMMDEESLTVTYRGDRGEPRSPHRRGDSWDNRGDCIDCNACVVSCPMGIDIRDGQQFECITCALCIDACDDVMGRIGRPRGLVDYDSLANAERRAKGQSGHPQFFRSRVLVYVGILMLVATVMVASLVTRPDTKITVLHDRNPLFTRLSDGSIRNGYTFKILNKTRVQRTFSVSVKGSDTMRLDLIGAKEVGLQGAPRATVRPDRVQGFRLLLTLPGDRMASPSMDIQFVLKNLETGETATHDSVFRGPAR